MAKFVAQLPTQILNDVDFLKSNALDIFKGMTKAGAEKAAENIRAGSTRAFGRLAGEMNSKLKVTKSYITNKDEIVTASRFYGYIRKNDDKPFYLKTKGRVYGPYPGIPAPLIAILTEYGPVPGSKMPEPFQRGWRKKKYPFIRPAFSDTKGITDAMLKAQKELSGGRLE